MSTPIQMKTLEKLLLFWILKTIYPFPSFLKGGGTHYEKTLSPPAK